MYHNVERVKPYLDITVSPWLIVSRGITNYLGKITVWCYIVRTPSGYQRVVHPAFRG